MNEFGVAIPSYVARIAPPSYQDNKRFEEYLLIKSTIETECKSSLKNILLQNLQQAYTTGQNLSECFEVNKKIITALAACIWCPIEMWDRLVKIMRE